jgi:hypothetical protein
MGLPPTGLPALVARRIENRVTGVRARTDRRSLEMDASQRHRKPPDRSGRGDTASKDAGEKKYVGGLDNSGNIEGRYEGTAFVLGRRGLPQCGSAIVTSVMIDPQYVGGAAHGGWHPNTDIKSGHQTDCRLRRHSHGGKKFEKSAHKGSVSLDKGSPSMWPPLSSSFYCLPCFLGR